MIKQLAKGYKVLEIEEKLEELLTTLRGMSSGDEGYDLLMMRYHDLEMERQAILVRRGIITVGIGTVVAGVVYLGVKADKYERRLAFDAGYEAAIENKSIDEEL